MNTVLKQIEPEEKTIQPTTEVVGKCKWSGSALEIKQL